MTSGPLMAFSDGVFAVAITLLVFNVPVPAIAQSDAMSRLPDALLNSVPPLVTVAVSFFLVGFYWIRQHQLFRQVVSADQWLLWLNLVVLFLVCLLPFSSGVVGRYHNTVIAVELYAVNLAGLAIAFSALYLYATRAHQVRGLPPGTGIGFFSQGLILPVVVVAMVMALAPLNLAVAYVTGVTLMALVGIYTAAVPHSVRSASLRGSGGGRLRFTRVRRFGDCEGSAGDVPSLLGHIYTREPPATRGPQCRRHHTFRLPPRPPAPSFPPPPPQFLPPPSL